MQPRALASRTRLAAPKALSSAARQAAQRAAARKSDAEFKAMYETHFRLVRCALTRLGVREADVTDMAQKVFLVAFLKLPEFEGRSQLSTWLWAICRRVAIAYRRSGAMRLEVATDPLEIEISCEQRGVTQSEPNGSHELAIEHMLSKLSESQRLVFRLSEVDELDGAQIAALLNISLGTVRSRLRYARQRIRREMKRLSVASAFSQKTAVPHKVGGSRRSWEHLEFAS
ncbi:MAG: sigma-70 family RNA polymerase sigma factor [Pseudomonadota bacterium]